MCVEYIRPLKDESVELVLEEVLVEKNLVRTKICS